MEVIETGIPGLLVIQPKVWADDRGYFYESYNEQTFKAHGIDYEFVQDNQSKSVKGVLRGLHYQLAPYAQAKLVRVFKGEVLDVAVDIRKGSPTYGKFHAEILSEENKTQLMIPRGFAHGFIVLSDEAEFFYKCDNPYNKESEAGILFNDPALAIDWQLPASTFQLSDKDKELPLFADCINNFIYSGE